MRKIHLFPLITTIVIIPMIFFGIYFLKFHWGLSNINSEWGDFGDYLAGTIGICFTLIGVALMYFTFYEQRKQQFENAFQQYISNYYGLLNLIKERWLHTASEQVFDMKGNRVLDKDGNDIGNPIYQTGREIFGNAIGDIKSKNEEVTFKEIFDKHINVFQHYCNYLIEFFIFLDNNNELNKKEKISYIERLFSMLSVYELTFFAYYIEFIFKDIKRDIIRNQLIKELNRIIVSDNIPHIINIVFIKKVLDLTPPKPK